MLPRSRSSRSVMTLGLLALSAGAAAWTPSTEPPRGDGQPAQTPETMPGYPTNPAYPGYGPPMGYPDSRYPGSGYRMPPMQGMPGPGPGADSGPDTVEFAGMRLTQQRTDDAYTLDIELNGMEPAQVRITPNGPALMIVAEQTAGTSREETFAEGGGFRRSFSYSSGRSMKRLPVPPDGDLANMRRDDADGHIRISIPRIAQAPAAKPQPEQQ